MTDQPRRLIGHTSRRLRYSVREFSNAMPLLTDAEIAAVAGGAIAQSISIAVTQRNTSVITQTTTAINSSSVVTATATDALAVAVGAEATNAAVVSQANVVAAINCLVLGHH
jgi:hypothetical protein